MKIRTNPVTGTLDYMPVRAEQRQWMIENILDEYSKNGFLLIKTPILESLDNLVSGDSGDNTKLMFKTIKRGESLNKALAQNLVSEKDLVEEGLKYDQTVPLVRFFLANKNNLTLPFKSIQIDESFRAEKPQKGRNRQFTQCDIDIFGDNTNLAEIEILTTVASTYKKLGLNDVEIRISSRKILNEIILSCGYSESEINSVCIIIDKLDKIGFEKVEEELALVGNEIVFDKLDARSKKLVNILKQVKENGLIYLEQINCAGSEVASLKEIIEVVSENIPKGFLINFDITIIRGQGYYTGTVFEVYDISTSFTRAIGGGGRYDNMIKNFGGEDISAVGFGLGLDSTMLVLEETGKLTSENKIALIYYKETTKTEIIKAKAEYLKNNPNAKVSVFPFPKNFNEFERRAKLNGFEIKKMKQEK